MFLIHAFPPQSSRAILRRHPCRAASAHRRAHRAPGLCCAGVQALI